MRIYQTLVLSLIVLVLSACSGETVSEGLDKVEDVQEWFGEAEEETTTSGDLISPGLGAATTSVDGLTPTGEIDIDNAGQSNAGGDLAIEKPYVDSVLTNSEEIVPVPDSETSQLTTGANFLFKTARTIRLKVDLASAMGTEASVSLCTDFEEIESGYTINYESCPIRGAVIGGQFQSDIALPNQFESAIAVIWFPYQESEPLYRKFQMTDLSEGGAVSVWLWN